MFVLIIFSDASRSFVVKMLQFRRMKRMIEFTGGRASRYDARRNHDRIKCCQRRTKKSLFEVVKAQAQHDFKARVS